MAKNLLQDMVKVRKPLKTQIPLKKETPQRMPPEAFTPPPTPPTPLYVPNSRGSRKYGLWVVAAVCVLFFLFALSFLFAKAEITINPRTQDIVLNENLSAIKDSTDGLSFDVVIISGEETKNVIASEVKEVSASAQGTIFIYNAFSSDPQQLSQGTRLEGSNGKIYKTSSSVTVPGMDTEGVPGKVEAGIIATEAGEAYNSGPLDFTILSFKGTSKYSKFYGRSKGEIAGGFIGNSPVISDTDQAGAFSELKSALREKLLSKAGDQIPGGFILYKDAAFLQIDSQNVGFNSAGSDVPVTMKGTLYGFLFNEEKLTKKIAKDNAEKYDDTLDTVYIPNIRDLTFTLTDQNISFAEAQNINFNLTGSAKIVWKFDSTKLAADLLGKPKSEFNQILSAYTNIDSADLVLSPFWARSLPSKLNKIKVTVNYPK